MTFLLDTDVVSELRKPSADPNVAEWSQRLDRREVFLSVVTIREVEAGVVAMEHRDAVRGARSRAWLEQQVLADYADRILPVDLAVARRSASLHVPGPRAERDALIAATALVHGLTVATRNVVDLEPMGVDVVDPWRA